MGVLSSPFIFLLTFFLASSNAVPPLQEYPPEFGSIQDQILVKDRLPLSIIPSSYRLEIQPILDPGFGQLFTAPGKIWITGLCNSSSISSITLNYRDLEINQAATTVSEVGPNTQLVILNQVLLPQQEFFTISLDRALSPGLEYVIYIEFTAKVNSNPNALYYSSYLTPDGTLRYLASTDFEAPDARQAWPCFDEPHLKATWEISILRHQRYNSLSNMPLLRTEILLDLPGWEKDIYPKTVPMSSYLVCLAVSDYKVVVADNSLYQNPIGIWAPAQQIDQGEATFSPDFTAKVMKSLEEYYGVLYSLPKMDKISIPNFNSGAMENWGLNTYRPSRLLYEEGVSTIQDFFSMTNTISHELVHQWFGNLITCLWWDDLWIQEGAATYYAPIGVLASGHADLLPMETLLTSSIQRSFDFDSSSLTHPLHNDGIDPSNVPVLFDTLTYHKGAALIRMMNDFLTEPIYKEAMTQFLTKFAFKNSNQNDMFAVIDEVVSTFPSLLPAGLSVSRIMANWTLKKGYPLLSVERNNLNSFVTFTQSHFVRDKNNTTPDATLWTIPISLFTPGQLLINNLPVQWLLDNQTSTTRTIREPLFIVNPHSSGYYRVEYKNELLDNIIEQLHSNHSVFDVQIRSQLVDDNLNLAYSGYLGLEKALNLTMYLTQERELFPWISFVTNMALPYRMFARSSAFPSFKNYITTLMKPTLNDIKIEPQPGESIPTIMLRTRLYEWSCNHGDVDCIADAKSKFASWMANPSNTSVIFPDLQASVYCTAIANGGDAEWNFVLEQYKQSLRDLSQLSLLRALACSKTSFRLNHLLDLALDRTSALRDNQRTTAMQAVAGNSAGVEIAFNYIRNNYETIVRRYGTGIINSVLTTIANSFNQATERVDLKSFLDSKPGLSQSSLATVESNIIWRNKHFPSFINFLQTI